MKTHMMIPVLASSGSTHPLCLLCLLCVFCGIAFSCCTKFLKGDTKNAEKKKI
jgi:hypothetical protein